MKRVKKGAISLAVLSMIAVGHAYASSPGITINGVAKSFSQSPVLEGGYVLVPMRGIFEVLGAKVDYDANTQTVSAAKGNTQISLQVGSKEATLNGVGMSLPIAPEVINGSTMVPIRFVSATLGAQVSWDQTTQTVIITTTGPTLQVQGNAGDSTVGSTPSSSPQTNQDGNTPSASQQPPVTPIDQQANGGTSSPMPTQVTPTPTSSTGNTTSNGTNSPIKVIYNGQERPLPVSPQKVNGQLMLPLDAFFSDVEYSSQGDELIAKTGNPDGYLHITVSITPDGGIVDYDNGSGLEDSFRTNVTPIVMDDKFLVDATSIGLMLQANLSWNPDQTVLTFTSN